MAISFLAVLRDAHAALVANHPSEPHEAALARRLTRELDEAIGRLEAKEPERDLLSIVCHDLKEPLASITMGAGDPERQLRDAKALELALKSGALPAPLRLVGEETLPKGH